MSMPEPMRDFHTYASLKTTGQLALDIGSITTHICTLIALLKYQEINETTDTLKYVLVAVIIFQGITAIGLFLFRMYDLNNPYHHNKARWLNYIFFAFFIIIALLEASISVFERFFLEHPIGINGTSCANPNS